MAENDRKIIDQYYHAIGRVAVAAGRLEDVIIGITLNYCDASAVNIRQLHAKLLYRGMATNIRLMRRRVRQRVSEASATALQPKIDSAFHLNAKRNELIHAAWTEMVDAHTGEFHKFQRFRYIANRGDVEPTWDVSTPKVEEIEAIAVGLNACANDLADLADKFWNSDPRVVDWRLSQISN